MTHKVRFSIIDYLNALPLNMAFKDRIFGDVVEMIFDFPSQCADNLAADKAEVGLISSIEYQRISDLLVAPDICIASKKVVRSVLILTRKDLKDVKTVALDRFSRSSVALVHILFERRFQAKPHFVSMTPDAMEMLDHADAALIIGDAALNLPEGDYQVIDLATEWFSETGLPFVFAFWAIRKDSQSRHIAEMLLKAKQYGTHQIPHRVSEIQARWPLSEADILSYFSTNIHYDLGKAEEESLARFYQYAFEAKLIGEVKPLRFA